MKFKDAIEICRPINDIMGGLTVIIGILNTRTGVSLDLLIINIILGMITYFFLAASGMIINDIYDIEIDKINRPDRPIPSGRISMEQAKKLFIGTYAFGSILSLVHGIVFLQNLANFIIATFFGFIGWVYAKWGKKSGFIGNLIVSLSFSIGLVYGAVLNGYVPIFILYFYFTASFLLLSREIIKGCEDVEGDKEFGVKTLAIKIGIKKARLCALIAAIAAIIFFILPMFTNIINPLLFLIPMIGGVILVSIPVVLMLKTDLEKKDFSLISKLLKISMLVGLIAFIFASI